MSKNIVLDASPIDWETAKKLIAGYNNHSDKWLLEEGEDTLSAFRINVEKIREVINGDNPEQNVVDLLIVLGHNDGTITSPTHPEPRVGFTTIMFGIDNENNLITNGIENIQDYLDTCPPKCPKKVEQKQLHEWT